MTNVNLVSNATEALPFVFCIFFSRTGSSYTPRSKTCPSLSTPEIISADAVGQGLVCMFFLWVSPAKGLRFATNDIARFSRLFLVSKLSINTRRTPTHTHTNKRVSQKKQKTDQKALSNLSKVKVIARLHSCGNAQLCESKDEQRGQHQKE